MAAPEAFETKPDPLEKPESLQTRRHIARA
ncbi:MAG: hypothetical protein RL759_396, partial [Verrucomicrobiota bacterium]